MLICVWSWGDEVGLIQENVRNVWEEKIMTSLASPEPHAQTAALMLYGGSREEWAWYMQ